MTIAPHADLLVFSAIGFSTFFAVPSLVVEKYEQMDPRIDFVGCVFYALKEFYAGYLLLAFPFLLSSLFILMYLIYPAYGILEDAMYFCLVGGTISSIFLSSAVCIRASIEKIFNTKSFVPIEL